MNMAEARRQAKLIASAIIEQRLTGGDGRFTDNDADERRLERALDDLAQRLWEQGQPKGRGR